VAIEHHFVEVGGRVYTSLAFGYDYWREYLELFDEVCVLARVGRAGSVPEDHFRADGDRVRFLPMPNYLGPRQLLWRLPGVLAAARRAAGTGDRFLLRSGNVCTALWLWLALAGRPYAREVQGHVGEGVMQFSGGRGLAGRIFAHLGEALCRFQLRGAHCASYVSEFCRRLYPTGRPDREFVFSSVQLTPELVRSPREASSFDHRPLRVLSVGRVEREKGHHVLVEAARLLRTRGVDGWTITIIGPGRQVEPLRETVRREGLTDHVAILGPVRYGAELFAHLDVADLFVLPSLTEGMPRSLIEAMARGLPAVASRTGGIVELLDEGQLVLPGRTDLLADAIAARIGAAERLASDSKANFHAATARFDAARMREHKHAFWRAVSEGPAVAVAESEAPSP